MFEPLVFAAWLLAASFSAPEWSPDGAAVAFCAEDGRAGAVFPDGWLFDFPAATSQSEEPEARGRVQVWIASADGRSLRLLDDFLGVASSPSWLPDGSAVAYLRFRADPASPSDGVMEFVRTPLAGPPAVLMKEKCGLSPSLISELAFQRPAISPNGLLGCAAWPPKESLLLISMIDGSTLRQWKGASYPSWAPDGATLAFFRAGDSPGVYLAAESGAAEPVLAVKTMSLAQPPIWERGGGAFFIAREGSFEPRADPQADAHRAEIVRVALSDRRTQVVHRSKLASDLPPRTATLSFSYEDESESMFANVFQLGQPTYIEWFEVDGHQSKRNWHPIDVELVEHPIPLGGLAASPTGDRVAFRFGAPSWHAPIGICSLRADRFEALVANEQMFLESLWALDAAVSRVVRRLPGGAPSPFLPDAEPVRRTSRRRALLPRGAGPEAPSRSPLDHFDRPTEQSKRESEAEAALRRLSGFGLELLASAAGKGRSPVAHRRMLESALLLHYVREEYAQALDAARALAALEGPAWPAEYRLALATVEVQCLVALGRHAAAKAKLDDVYATRERALERSNQTDDPVELPLFGIHSGVLGRGKPSPQRDPLLERLRNLADDLGDARMEKASSRVKGAQADSSSS